MQIKEELIEELEKLGNCKCDVDKACGGLKEEVANLTRYLRTLLYPVVFNKRSGHDSIEEILNKIYNSLKKILLITDKVDLDLVYNTIISKLPMIKQMLDLDVEAAYEGDPAAKSKMEIMLSYPSFEALSIYRIAHEFYLLKATTIARMMSEYAHILTGIDIHPGATIGKSFFIDHGTGVVIGETTVIGNHVKIYQGVTLGAKSFVKDKDGHLIKGIKRHPNIEDNVIIYANATILGGETVIGEGAIIGGNMWITESVEKGRKVINK